MLGTRRIISFVLSTSLRRRSMSVFVGFGKTLRHLVDVLLHAYAEFCEPVDDLLRCYSEQLLLISRVPTLRSSLGSLPTWHFSTLWLLRSVRTDVRTSGHDVMADSAVRPRLCTKLVHNRTRSQITSFPETGKLISENAGRNKKKKRPRSGDRKVV